MDKKNLSDKFHENLCNANIKIIEVIAIGQTLSLVRDDLPQDAVEGMGDLIHRLGLEVLSAISGMEDAQGNTTQAG